MAQVVTQHSRGPYDADGHMWINAVLSLAQAFCGWLYGQFPPGLLANFKLAGAHLLNMFRAHTAAYNAIKELPGAYCLQCVSFGSRACGMCARRIGFLF